MINLQVIRETEEYMKTIKVMFESLLEEFKGDTNVLGVDVIVSNHTKESSAIYIEMDVYLTKPEDEDDLIIRVMNHVRNLEDWVVLCLYVGALGIGDESEVRAYSLNTNENIKQLDMLEYATFSHYYGDDERVYSYELKEDKAKGLEDSKTAPNLKTTQTIQPYIIKRMDKLFSGYEYEVSVLDYE